MFDHILNWKLLKGSHEFPGPHGGTCVNEAAIVAAGFEYRAVSSANDCPPCFSRPISAYAIGLNDPMPDDLRQKLLLPFITRLAGTADAPKIEQNRIELIVLRTMRDILPVALRLSGLEKEASRCAAVKCLTDAASAAKAAVDAANIATFAANAATHAANAASYAAEAVYAANAASYATFAANAATFAAKAATFAAWAARAAAADAARVWALTTSILDEAICMGNQAPPPDHDIVIARMERAKIPA